MAPTAIAAPNATRIATTSVSSRPPETPSSSVLDSVTIAGTERSMPRPINTMDCPIAAIARNAANGMMANTVSILTLRGRNTAPMANSNTSAIQIATNRICTAGKALREGAFTGRSGVVRVLACMCSFPSGSAAPDGTREIIPPPPSGAPDGAG